MIGCIVLTMGTRPEELRHALDSLLRQKDVDRDIVVVGNGWDPEGLPGGVRGVHLTDNRGATAGRNAGVEHVRGDILLFLDDDARLPEDGALRRIAAEFDADTALGALQPQVVPSDGGRPLREWVPRLRSGDPERSSDVTALWEGAVAVRRSVFDEAGGWPEDFGILHEGVDLAWRIMDTGHRVHYLGEVTVLHPARPPSGRAPRHYQGARNRVLLARRHLPWPLGALYVSTFVVRQIPRLRSRGETAQALRGYRDGMRVPLGTRRKLRPRTLWRMTVAGRPPVI